MLGDEGGSFGVMYISSIVSIFGRYLEDIGNGLSYPYLHIERSANLASFGMSCNPYDPCWPHL
jgi:hypothetical protein